MKPLAIVSAADARYYPLLCELIASIKAVPQGRTADVCLINAGMTAEQTTSLTQQGCVVRDADWPAALDSARVQGREFLKGCVCRPFIPQIFPGYETYIWLDGDTWVQDGAALDLLIAGAGRRGFAVVPQVDRAYGKAMRLSWLGPLPWRPRSFYYSNARKAFSGKIARQLFPYPTVNAGVFAMEGTAPHWKRWQELISQALVRGNPFTAEQLSMGAMIYLDRMPAEFLPAWCNWLCATPPAWDEQKKLFVEPYLPHHPIGIMHLSGLDEMRLDPILTQETETTAGRKLNLSYRYAARA